MATQNWLNCEQSPGKGAVTPRIFTQPLRELTPDTSLGFAAIEFAEQVLRVELVPWQRWFLVHALELKPTGAFRYRTIMLLIARQNGKSTIMQILALFLMFVRAIPLVIGTAQDLDTAEEVWQGAVDIVEGCEELEPEIQQVLKVNGKKTLWLTNGSRWKVKAANRKGGRGLSGDLVLLDELREHRDWDAWGAITKTTMARANALIFGASNAGDASSVVLAFLRRQAHAALGNPDQLKLDDEAPELSDTVGWFEYSAHPSRTVDDRDGWAEANPSLGHLITEEAIASAASTDPEWVFRTEVLCQWPSGVVEGPFGDGVWESGIDTDSFISGEPIYGVDTAYNRSTTYIGVAGKRDDGQLHCEIVERGPGMDWVVGWFAERSDRPMTVVIQGKGAPATDLIEQLEQLKHVTVIAWDGSNLTAGCGLFFDLVVQRRIRHLPQPLLDMAANSAVLKPLGDAWAWNRKASPVDVAPLIAVTAATWWLLRQPPPKKKSVYEKRSLATV